MRRVKKVIFCKNIILFTLVQKKRETMEKIGGEINTKLLPVGRWPRLLITTPSSVTLMVPSSSLSNSINASLNSDTCSSFKPYSFCFMDGFFMTRRQVHNLVFGDCVGVESEKLTLNIYQIRWKIVKTFMKI